MLSRRRPGWCGCERGYAREDTATAAVKAALIERGEPTTRQKLSQMTGVEARLVGSHLSRVESMVRVDKSRWGISDWVEQPYEGIAAEISRRVRGNGGKVEMSRLVSELTSSYGVSARSVRTTAVAPAFRWVDGWVSLADPPQMPEPPSEALWSFAMHQRYLSGYSISGVPREVALVLGCRLGEAVTVKVAGSGQGCRDVSVIWRATCSTGPEIGRAAEALAATGARPGDTVTLHAREAPSVEFVVGGGDAQATR